MQNKASTLQQTKQKACADKVKLWQRTIATHQHKNWENMNNNNFICNKYQRINVYPTQICVTICASRTWSRAQAHFTHTCVCVCLRFTQLYRHFPLLVCVVGRYYFCMQFYKWCVSPSLGRVRRCACVSVCFLCTRNVRTSRQRSQAFLAQSWHRRGHWASAPSLQGSMPMVFIFSVRN